MVIVAFAQGGAVQIFIVNSDTNRQYLLKDFLFLPNLRERAEGIKKTYMSDNARRRIKIQIKKKEKK